MKVDVRGPLHLYLRRIYSFPQKKRNEKVSLSCSEFDLRLGVKRENSAEVLQRSHEDAGAVGTSVSSLLRLEV